MKTTLETKTPHGNVTIMQPGITVIIVGNNGTALETGEFLRWERGIPVVNTHHNGTRICFGITIPYTEEMFNFLNALPRERQWEIMSQLVLAREDVAVASENKWTT